MSFLKLFKRKEGGTMVGNLLRGVAHSINPMLGNGAMKLRPGEKPADANARASKEFGATMAGAQAGNQLYRTTDNLMENAKKGAGKLLIPIIALVGIVVALFAFRKKRR